MHTILWKGREDCQLSRILIYLAFLETVYFFIFLLEENISCFLSPGRSVIKKKKKRLEELIAFSWKGVSSSDSRVWRSEPSCQKPCAKQRLQSLTPGLDVNPEPGI